MSENEQNRCFFDVDVDVVDCRLQIAVLSEVSLLLLSERSSARRSVSIFLFSWQELPLNYPWR